MSESKITCPNCDQHILADDGWAGQTITCPACQQSITVPGSPIPVAAPAPSVRLNHPTAPPPPPPAAPRPQPVRPTTASQPATTGRTSGLAITSLVLSLTGCLSLGGVICGHLARRQIRRDPSVGGNGLALAGLILGYLGVAITAGFLALAVYGFVKGPEIAKQFEKEMAEAQARGEMPTFDGTNFVGGKLATGAMKEVAVPVPVDAVAGTINGSPFDYSRAKLNVSMGLLEIEEGDDFIADQSVKVFLFPKNGESLANRTWKITAAGAGMKPHVHLSWKKPDGTSGSTSFTAGYTMELATGEIVDGTVSGTLSLKITGKNPVDLKGKFTATVK